eukprot:218808-Pelagomonas_calceolata.AAC.3
MALINSGQTCKTLDALPQSSNLSKAKFLHTHTHYINLKPPSYHYTHLSSSTLSCMLGQDKHQLSADKAWLPLIIYRPHCNINRSLSIVLIPQIGRLASYAARLGPAGTIPLVRLQDRFAGQFCKLGCLVHSRQGRSRPLPAEMGGKGSASQGRIQRTKPIKLEGGAIPLSPTYKRTLPQTHPPVVILHGLLGSAGVYGTAVLTSQTSRPRMGIIFSSATCCRGLSCKCVHMSATQRIRASQEIADRVSCVAFVHACASLGWGSLLHQPPAARLALL